ncbi:hypothetical protein [Streptomyces sp. NPDC002044]|uniref:hypothetical protein n=1 Tax=Streptomyces sp. NPDC002044 TaxID=3154662 RepID=UPI00332A3985
MVTAGGPFDGSTGSIRALGLLGFALPATLGVFRGAPLLGRESESGTAKLALTQGIGIETVLYLGAVAALIALILFVLRPAGNTAAARSTDSSTTAAAATAGL